MSNLYFLKLENLLSVNNENLKKINLSVLNANEQGQTVFSNIDSSIKGINSGLKILSQNVSEASKNFADYKKNLIEVSKGDWPGPRNWKPASHDPERIIDRAVPPKDPNLSVGDKIWNYASVITGIQYDLPVFIANQIKNLYDYREKERKGENPEFDTRGLIIDALFTLAGMSKIKWVTAISTYYGLTSADGIRPEEYFTKNTYSTKPLGDLSSSTSNALLTKNQQLKDSKETQNAVNWFIDRERLINELQAPYKNKSRKELKDIDNAFTETLKEKFEPEAHKGGIPKKKTKKVYQQKIGDYRRFNGAAGQNSHFEEEELGEEISETANYATQKPKLGNSKKVTNPEKAFEAIFNKKNIGMMKVFDETIQGVGQNIGSFFTGLAQGNPDAFKNFFLYPDNFYIA